MDFLATPRRRKFLFACLYLSEGAPIGFIWLALPTQLRAEGVAVGRIAQLAALLVLPWTFKFLWAPLVDVARSHRWTYRHWIITAQTTMSVTLVPLLWLDLSAHFDLLTALLLVHAFAAATQDVAIDAMCISVTRPGERGEYNGWMQAGMLVGRALMGGGALVLAQYLGAPVVILLLIAITTFSLVLVGNSKLPETPMQALTRRLGRTAGAIREAARTANTWIGLAFGLVGGAAFKALEVIYGPMLVDRGYRNDEIGWFSAFVMIGCMIAGSLAGGTLADRLGRRRFVALALAWIIASATALALADLWMAEQRGPHLFVCLAVTAFGIGLFTAASYALFMDLTLPAIGATQFSAFMGATNGCESWSSLAIGRIIEPYGYAAGILAMAAASLIALPLVLMVRLPPDSEEIDRR